MIVNPGLRRFLRSASGGLSASLLLEDGTGLLLEDGTAMLLESFGVVLEILLLEDGTNTLLEDGTSTLLEQ